MNLFAYGTLMWPEVITAVIGRCPAGEPAMLPGYRRLRVKGEHYPVIVRSAGDAVEGIVYCGLTAAEFERLDAFEGEEYDRIAVSIGQVKASVYVLSEEWKHIADSMPWFPEQLSAEHLAAFCAEYKGWS